MASPARAAEPSHLLKVATLAPEGSAWVRALRQLDADLRTSTDSAVGLKIYPGGVQGDDAVLIRKMRVGQLHVAALSGQGVTDICRDVVALEMPFLFSNYGEVDYVLEQMDGYYRDAFSRAGFPLLGWSDIGFVHILSRNPIRSVEDIRRSTVWRLEGEPITAALFGKAGVRSYPLGIPDVLLGLQTKLIDVAYAPPQAAIVMQWFSRIEYVTELPINYALGALVITRRALAALDPAHRPLLVRLATERLSELTRQTRLDNEEAMRVMLANGVQLAVPEAADVAAFHDLVAECEPELVGKAFSRDALDQVRAHLREYRTRSPSGP